MPRAIWSGSISFGLVNVPVKLYPAVHQNDLSFHQFEEGTNARIHNKRVSEKTGKEVVALDEIDPIYYDKTYYLTPGGGEGAGKAYALLREAMGDQEKVAIGRLVLRTK